MPPEANFLGPYNDRIQRRPLQQGRRGRSRFSTQPKFNPVRREAPQSTHRVRPITRANAVLFGGYIFEITQVEIPLVLPGEYIYTVHPIGDLAGAFEPEDHRRMIENVLMTNVEMQVVQNASTTEQEVAAILRCFGLQPFSFED